MLTASSIVSGSSFPVVSGNVRAITLAIRASPPKMRSGKDCPNLPSTNVPCKTYLLVRTNNLITFNRLDIF